MSLEETIAANTAAVLTLTAALNKPLWLDPKMLSGFPASDPKPADQVQASTDKAVAQDIGKAAGVLAAAAVSATAAAPLAAAAGVVAAATITDVLTAASQLIADPAKGKTVLKAALTSVGVTVTKLSEIPAEKLTDALAAIKKAIAA